MPRDMALCLPVQQSIQIWISIFADLDASLTLVGSTVARDGRKLKTWKIPTLASHQVSTFFQDQALRKMTTIFACRMTTSEILPSHRGWRYMDPVALGHIQAFLHGGLSGFQNLGGGCR